jgi:hypothetical protein
MKPKFLALTSVFCFAFGTLFSQNYDSSISIDDIIDALAINGIQIHKCNIGSFDKGYLIHFTFDEYLHGELIKSDTIPVEFSNQIINRELDTITNEYIFKASYLNNIQVITKIESTNLTIRINTQNGSLNDNRDLKENYNVEGFYQIFKNIETKWKLNEKVSLVTCVSSWKDENTGQNRLCGVFPDLLKDTSHYIEICYYVTVFRM